MTPERYATLVQDQVIADMNNLVFEKKSGEFVVPVYMSPEEYGQYAQDKKLPLLQMQ